MDPVPRGLPNVITQTAQLYYLSTQCSTTVQGWLAGTGTSWAGLTKQPKHCRRSSAAPQMAAEVGKSNTSLTDDARGMTLAGLHHERMTRHATLAGNSMEPRFAIMAAPGPQYVAATWASWLSGGIAVPLCLTHPPGWAFKTLSCQGVPFGSSSCEGSILADFVCTCLAPYVWQWRDHLPMQGATVRLGGCQSVSCADHR